MLSDVTVVELSARGSTGYCGKLLHDLGATVVKVEPAAGDPMRAASPAYAAFLHAGKRSGVAEPGPATAALLARLADRVDVVVCDDDDPATVAQVLAIRHRHPGLVVVALSDYGLDGPLAGAPATDFTLQAEAGSASCT